MPKKIRNPLRDGMPSKIYLAAYPEAISGYQIGQKIQRVDNPRLDRIYNIVNKDYSDLFERMEQKGERGGPKPIISRSEPLITEFEDILGERLTDLEKEKLLQFLNSKEFRLYVGKNTKDSDFAFDVDASRMILGHLNILSGGSLLFKEWGVTKSFKRGMKTTKTRKQIRELAKLEGLKGEDIPVDLMLLFLDIIPKNLMQKFLTIHERGFTLYRLGRLWAAHRRMESRGFR